MVEARTPATIDMLRKRPRLAAGNYQVGGGARYSPKRQVFEDR